MRVTTKGQVTIPIDIREKLNIEPNNEVEFVEKNGKVYLRKINNIKGLKSRFSALRGTASVKLSTDEILSLTRS